MTETLQDARVRGQKERTMNSLEMQFPRCSVFLAGCGGLVLALGSGPSGCGADDGLMTASRISGLCNAGDSGGDLGCGCTLNSQCNRFDDDTRLIVCDVASGATRGVC